MAKFKPNPGEFVIREANAPCVGKSFGVVPGGFPGTGILTNQRFIHFKSYQGLDGWTNMAATLLRDKKDFEFPMTTLKALRRFNRHGQPALSLTTLDGKEYTLINEISLEKMDIDGWMAAFREVLARSYNKQLVTKADNLWAVAN